MAIFNHLTLGTNNLDKAKAFYDSALGALGLKQLFAMDTVAGWGTTGPEFMVLKPINGEPACVGNGLTIGFVAPNRAAVDAFHRNALAAGGKDEGAPGPRAFAENAYCAYVRDVDGNKIMAACMKPE